MSVTALILTILLAVQSTPSGTDDPFLHYLRASYYFRSARPQEAIIELRLAIEVDPDSSTPRVTLGKVLLSLNRRSEALTVLEEARELDPDNSEALRLIGRIALQQASEPGGKSEEVRRAEEAFRRAYELDPDDRESLFFLAMIYDRTGRIDEAIEAKQLLLGLDPSMRDVWISLANSFAQRGDSEGELQALDRAVSLDPANAELLRRAGEVASGLERYRQAFGYFERARDVLAEMIRDDPDNTVLHLQVAQLCLWNTRQFDLAVRGYERVIELTEGDENGLAQRFEAQVGKATALYSMQDYEPAVELFEQSEEIVLGHRPRSIGPMLVSYAHSNRLQHALEIVDELEDRIQDAGQRSFLKQLRAQVMNVAGRGEDADRLVEELISGDPSRSQNYVLLFLLRLERKEYELARKALERLETISSEGGRPVYYWGMLQWQTGDFNSARANMSAMVEKNPTDHQALNNLGYLLADRGIDLEEAQAYIRRALELQPYEGSYLDSLGWVYYKMGDLAEAEKYLTAAVRTQYRSAEVREHLGYLYLALGRPAEALAELQAALDLNLAELKSTAEVEKEIAKLRSILEEQQ